MTQPAVYTDSLNSVVKRDSGFIKLYLIFPFALQTILIMSLSNFMNPTIGLFMNVICTIAVVATYVFILERTMLMFIHLFVLIVTQNLTIGIGMTFTNIEIGSDSLKFLLINKEIFAIVFLLCMLIRYINKIRLYKYELTIPLVFGVSFLSFIISDASFDAKAYYLRTLFIIFVAYAIGRILFFSFYNKKIELNRVLSFVSYTGLLVAIIGFGMMMLPKYTYIWQDWFNLGVITETKTGKYSPYPNWSTPLGSLIFPRMFSIIFDPICLGYILATSLLCYIIKGNRMPFVTPILATALLFTLVKGAIAIVIISLLWTLFLRNKKIPPLPIVLTFIAATIAVFYILPYTGFKSSHDVHFNGFIEPILNLPQNLIGEGLGNGGNYYSMKVGIPAWELSYMGTESVIGVLVYQLGLPGLIPYVSFFMLLTSNLMKHSYVLKCKERILYTLLSGIVLSIFLAGMLQESALGINYTGILMAIIGFYVSKMSQNKQYNHTP
ncbi:hypothetical protein BBD41_03400 [Paenibacillus ihbetae]|uniref:O-antigen polymerase n=1 Tax=Paenibacillus ihbetae TaxID=1870820 RepID=A0A1B2DVH2_9BACL|nr:hypothetical protein [Paenibacillus ihbetae]ANY71703.1 hypothetical protein BBD41_03400 [Paenibacillus ihbetae]